MAQIFDGLEAGHAANACFEREWAALKVTYVEVLPQLTVQDDSRHRWADAYFVNKMTLAMTTTNIVESLNAKLKRRAGPITPLRQLYNAVASVSVPADFNRSHSFAKYARPLNDGTLLQMGEKYGAAMMAEMQRVLTMYALYLVIAQMNAGASSYDVVLESSPNDVFAAERSDDDLA